jgi:hypothetical protein
MVRKICTCICSCLVTRVNDKIKMIDDTSKMYQKFREVEYYDLGCNVVQCGRSSPTFRRNKLPPSLGL